jgi:hypothetical protein
MCRELSDGNKVKISGNIWRLFPYNNIVVTEATLFLQGSKIEDDFC